jgi:hypothetical protein
MFAAADLGHLESLRRAYARAATALRDAEDALDQWRVRATEDVLLAADEGDRDQGRKALGPHEQARLHRLARELCCHDALQKQARLARQARAKVQEIDAAIRALTDRRRFHEWTLRDRQTDALLAGARCDVLHVEEATA